MLGSERTALGSVRTAADSSAAAGGGSSSSHSGATILPGAKILETGDSIVAGYNDLAPVHADTSFSLLAPLERYLTESYTQFGLAVPTFVNTAVSGQTSAAWLAGINAQVLTPIAAGAKHALLCIGANDVAGAVPAATTAQNVFNGIVLAQAHDPTVSWHVILNAFIFSDDPASAFNVAMGVTNAAIAAKVATLRNVVVHDWQTAANEWARRNNPLAQKGVLVQASTGTHPSKPTGQVVASDCIFAQLALAIPSSYRLGTLGAQTPFPGTPWFQARSLEASYIAAYTGRLHHFPLRYVDVSTAALSTNDGNVEGGGIKAAGSRWIVNASQFQNVKTAAWGVAFRCNLSLQAAASFAEVGVLGAGGQICRVRNDVALGVNLQFQAINGTTTTIDLGSQLTAGYHDICLYFTGASAASGQPANTLNVLLDGNVVGTTATLTNFPTVPVAVYLQDGGTMTSKVSELVSFWVRP